MQIAAMVLTLLMGILLARALGVEGYGHYGIAMAVISIGAVPAEFGLPKLVVREVGSAAAKNDLPRLFGVLRWADRTCWIVAAAISAVIAAAVLLVLDAVDPLVGYAILWGLPTIPFVALAKVRGSALQGLNHIVRGQVPANLLRPLLFVVLFGALFTATDGATAQEAMALNSITAALALVAAHLWLQPRLPRERPPHLVERGRQWFSSSLPMAMADGVLVLHMQVAVLLVGILSLPTEVGLFRIAASIVTVVGMPVLLMNSVVSPVIARLSTEGDHRRLQYLCTRSAQVMALGVLLLVFPFLFWGADLIRLVFGAEFAPALPALLLLCTASFINAIFGPKAVLLTMTGHERRVTRAMFIGLLVSVAVALVAVPAAGSLGGSVSVLSWILVWNILAWNDARRLLRIETSLVPTEIASRRERSGT